MRDKETIGRIAGELVARGWIEPVQSRAKTQRYKMTEAGRTYAAESRHLFKWPATKSRIRPVYSFTPRIECIAHLHAEYARLGLNIERDMPRYQSTMLDDLAAGLDEGALAMMHDFWNYNAEVIGQRKGYTWGIGVRPAPPRIDLRVFLSGKGNLIAEWCPTGFVHGRLNPGSDWTQWRPERNRGVNYDSRPTNELMFIHNVATPAHHFPGLYDDAIYTPDWVMVDSILLHAATELVGELKRRLEHSFEVRMVTEIVEEWEKLDRQARNGLRDEVLATWTILDVEKRIRDAELKAIADFPIEYGCPIDVFVRTLVEADGKKATGPAPSPHTRDDRVSRSLKKAGHAKISIGVVARFSELLKRHRPELFPRPAPITDTANNASVVPFKRPNGAGDDGPAAA